MKPLLLEYGFVEVHQHLLKLKAASLPYLESLYHCAMDNLGSSESADVLFEYLGIDTLLPFFDIGSRSLKAKKRTKRRLDSANGRQKKKSKVWTVEENVRM